MINEFDVGRISAWCWMVQRGKPCANVGISNEDINDVLAYIKDQYPSKYTLAT